MSNKYGVPLQAPSKQTILPAMNDAGIVYGFYEIAETVFTGAEAVFNLPSGAQVPLKTVQVDELNRVEGPRLQEYVAAVWPAGMFMQSKPWDTAELIRTDDLGEYRYYIMASHTWALRQDRGVYLDSLWRSMDQDISPAAPTTPPTAEDAGMIWSASASYQAMFGNCVFFDFNWRTLFKAKSGGKDPVRITVAAQPAPVGGVVPMRASIIGRPTATSAGPIYDTIRITKLTPTLNAGAYLFKFEVVDTKDQRTEVEFTLTVV